MKRPVIYLCLVTAFALLASCSEQKEAIAQPVSQVDARTESIAPAVSGPECTKGEKWTYVVNNAIRTADQYAMKHNPSAGFVGINSESDFIKQYGGEFEGRHLLKVTNRHGGNTSVAFLLPLFDEHASSENLDDEGKLWKVVTAKHNGRAF